MDTIDTGASQFVVDVSTATDVGCVRETNEDRIICVAVENRSKQNKHALLAVVADGMGGHAAGEIASQLTVDEIRKHVEASDRLELGVIEEAFQKANQAVYTTSHNHPEYAGMGTTGTALVVVGDKVILAHVGDSRLYRIRDNNIVLLSEDHTLVREWVLSGIISNEEAHNHPNKNIITRSLGTYPKVDVLIRESENAKSGDIYILCSDGLYDLVDDEKIAAVCSSSPTDIACNKLVELAKERGGDDNISVIVAVCRSN